MKRVIVFAIVALLLSLMGCEPKSQVAETTKSQDLEELFVLIKAESMIDATMEGVTNMMKQQFANNAKDADKQAEMDKYFEYVMLEAGKMGKALMSEEMLPLYDKYFTQQDVKDMIAFYKSPIGQKTLELQPQISKDIMQVMVTKYMPDFQKKVQQKLKEMKEVK